MPKIGYGVAEFDAFASSCPYFNGNYPVNNGYGCSHPLQEEMTEYEPEEEELDANGADENGFKAGFYGECHCFSCPYGSRLNREDLSREDIFWDDLKVSAESAFEASDDPVQGPPESLDDYLVIPVTSEAGATVFEVDAWVKYQKYLNRFNPEWKQSSALLPFQTPPEELHVAEVMYLFGHVVGEGHHYGKKVGAYSFVDLLEIAKEYVKAYGNQPISDAKALPEFFDFRIQHDKRFDPILYADQECSCCGDGFTVMYHADGSYEYVIGRMCNCESDFHPINGVPSISEWLATLF